MDNVYKYVQRDGDIFQSVGVPDFKYILNQYIQDAIIYNGSGIYCFPKDKVNDVHEHTKRDFILLELQVKEDDLIRIEEDKVYVFKGVTPIREVSREEYEKWRDI